MFTIRKLRNQNYLTFRKLFYDIVLMTGTPEAVRFLKEQILKNDMSHLEMVVVLHQLPNNILIPSEQVLEELLELVQSHKFQESRVLRNIATMSFTTILEKACLAKDRETAFPGWVVGNLCTPESPILVNKWVPHLLRQLESAQTWDVKNELIGKPIFSFRLLCDTWWPIYSLNERVV